MLANLPSMLIKSAGSMLLSTTRRCIQTIRPVPFNIQPARSISSTRTLFNSLHDFFEDGRSLPIFERTKAPAYGRAWKADELRLKSFEDLHKLWFVLLKEKNLLATQKAEAQRLGQQWFGVNRLHKVSLSMARIKTVLTERKILHEKALGLRHIQSGKVLKPTAGELMVELEEEERKRLGKSKRHNRKRIRYHKRQHPHF